MATALARLLSQDHTQPSVPRLLQLCTPRPGARSLPSCFTFHSQNTAEALAADCSMPLSPSPRPAAGRGSELWQNFSRTLGERTPHRGVCFPWQPQSDCLYLPLHRDSVGKQKFLFRHISPPCFGCEGAILLAHNLWAPFCSLSFTRGSCPPSFACLCILPRLSL